MTVVPSATGGLLVDGHFDDNSDRLLKGANIWFADASTALATVMDSVVLVVKDSDATTQYTLTSVSVPAITIETPANVYTVSEIDVTGFPTGDVTLNWTGTLDGYEYDLVQTVAFDQTPDMVFVEGLTDTIEDSDVVLGASKVFTVRVRDSLNHPVDGYEVRAVFTDRQTGSVIERPDATLKALGTGLWTVTHTIAALTYSPDLDRYELSWDIQLEAGGSWFEIANSRRPLKIYGATADVTTGPLTYTTNDDIRKTIVGIDAFLADILPNQGEREILLNNKRQEASVYIHNMIKNTRVRAKTELLGQLEAYMVYRLVLLSAHGFAKFAVNDGQLELLDKHIKRLMANIFSPIATIRIGGR